MSLDRPGRQEGEGGVIPIGSFGENICSFGGLYHACEIDAFLKELLIH
ncbi:MAG: hypothetical protein AB1414_07885 [bacterium]